MLAMRLLSRGLNGCDAFDLRLSCFVVSKLSKAYISRQQNIIKEAENTHITSRRLILISKIIIVVASDKNPTTEIIQGGLLRTFEYRTREPENARRDLGKLAN
jgi:hypothetical protein